MMSMIMIRIHIVDQLAELASNTKEISTKLKQHKCLLQLNISLGESQVLPTRTRTPTHACVRDEAGDMGARGGTQYLAFVFNFRFAFELFALAKPLGKHGTAKALGRIKARSNRMCEC